MSLTRRMRQILGPFCPEWHYPWEYLWQWYLAEIEVDHIPGHHGVWRCQWRRHRWSPFQRPNKCNHNRSEHRCSRVYVRRTSVSVADMVGKPFAIAVSAMALGGCR